jgi:hypothetical protein
MFFQQPPRQSFFLSIINGGSTGWTLIEMGTVSKDLFLDALTTAYCEVAPKKLSDVIKGGRQ